MIINYRMNKNFENFSGRRSPFFKPLGAVGPVLSRRPFLLCPSWLCEAPVICRASAKDPLLGEGESPAKRKLASSNFYERAEARFSSSPVLLLLPRRCSLSQFPGLGSYNDQAQRFAGRGDRASDLCREVDRGGLGRVVGSSLGPRLRRAACAPILGEGGASRFA